MSGEIVARTGFPACLTQSGREPAIPPDHKYPWLLNQFFPDAVLKYFSLTLAVAQSGKTSV